MERKPTLEVSSAVVAKQLREKGKENPEALALLNQWLDQTAKEVEQGKMTNLGRNVAWAKLYRDAWLIEEATEAFNDAAEEAHQLGNQEVFKFCDTELKKLQTLPRKK